MKLTRKIALLILAGLIMGLFGSYMLAMQPSQLPVVVLNQEAICGKCGNNFEVDQKGTLLSPCQHIIHEKCLPQLFHREKNCVICQKEVNYFERKDFLFVEPTLKDKLVNRPGSLSLNLNPVILARALQKTNQQHIKEIENGIREYNVVMNAFNKVSRIRRNEIIESAMLRHELNLWRSGAAGVIGGVATYRLFSNPSFFKVAIAGCLAATTTYFLGNYWNKKIFDDSLQQKIDLENELAAALKQVSSSSKNINEN